MPDEAYKFCPECGERMGGRADRCLCGRPLDDVEATVPETESTTPETAPCGEPPDGAKTTVMSGLAEFIKSRTGPERSCPECNCKLDLSDTECWFCGGDVKEGAIEPEEPEEPEEPQAAPCAKCQTEISTKAKRCPQCGYEPSEAGTFTKLYGLGIALTVLLSLFMFLLQGPIWTGLAVLLLAMCVGASVPLFIFAAIRERKTPTNDSIL